ncbi:hypothetical protein NDR87_18775 [Nocardia sp. CDC159]|uniref:Uncharacterized protein n=1 Tax=Nocardia pulmonis TaxID=2951408 RepID=A0A9X2EB69_9NOCA|nr:MULTISPECIES: hypothetical protein [Nocardia]MCM6776265.1 hypothetical protein [Nocardia pulmonis]MCM6788409.1 hypothetical protein [Nocardia sp. CDC159]
MTLQNFLAGRGPLPLSRQRRQLKARRILLDLAAQHLFPHEGTDIPMARKAARAAADWHSASMIDAMLADPRLRIDLADE